MAPRSGSQSATPGPAGHGSPSSPADPTHFSSMSPGGSYSLESIRPGCKIFVQKPDVATGDIEQRRAEVLSRREKYRGRVKRGEEKPEVKVEDKYEYYVHYQEFNKRLDEWVGGGRLIISREVEWPKPADAMAASGHGHGHGGGSANSSQKKKTTTAGSSRSGSSTPATTNNHKASGDAPKDDLLRKAARKAASAAASQAAQQQPSAGQESSFEKKHLVAGEDDGSSDGDAYGEGEDSLMADGESPSQSQVDNEDGAVVAMELLGDESMDVSQQGGGSIATIVGQTNGDDPVTASKQLKKEPISKEAEIEKLRTSGSMTQSVSEVARVKNFDCIRMGAHEIETWYFSPYPIEYASMGMLYICEMCLSYYPSAYSLKRHRTKCTLTHPPGNEIYRHEDISFFEIDGRKQKTWCRNLCLLSKCFLDHKTLYYDVDPFLYYVMVQRDDTGCHIIGYFSKEKESAEGYNVACILTLPQHQRSGFGRLLIDFSYELSKREHKLGSPEKPLSDLGLLGYRAYWAETIVAYLLDKGDGEETSIDEVAWKTCITHADVLHTCTSLNMLKQFQGKHYLVLNDQVLANHEKQMAKRKRRIKGDNLSWIPPVFSRAQLQFGW